MEAAATLSTKIFTTFTNHPHSHTHTHIPLSPLTLNTSAIKVFSPSSNFTKLQHFILFPRTDPRWVTKSHVPSETKVLPDFDSTFQKLRQSKTTHVKFQLQKECMYGHQIFLVGDNPMIGFWNPSNAIPLNWSEGHTWSVELDIPAELTMQFKFIIKNITEEIVWQPGPDRNFKTWESKNTIIIAEDWENSKAQKITEEQPFNKMINPGLETAVSGEVGYAYDVTCLEEDGVMNANKELMSEESVGKLPRKEVTKKENLRSPAETVEEEEEESSFSCEGEPVLVPGLSHVQKMSPEEALSKELGSMIGDNSIGINSSKD